MWLKSYKTHCETHLFYWPGFQRYNREFFGASFPHGQEKAHVKAYLAHAQHVEDYFREQKDRFLRICFETDPAWQRLCAFLGCEMRHDKVPHLNVRVSGIPWRRFVKRLFLHGYGLLEGAMGRKCAIHYR